MSCCDSDCIGLKKMKEKQEDALMSINKINGLHLARHRHNRGVCSTQGVLGGIVTNTLEKVLTCLGE